MIKQLFSIIGLAVLMPSVAQAMETKAAAAKAGAGVMFIDDTATNIRAATAAEATAGQVESKALTAAELAEADERLEQADALNAKIKAMSLIEHLFYMSEAYPALDEEIKEARVAKLENRIIVITLDAIWCLVHEGTLLEWRDEDNINKSKEGGWDLQVCYEQNIFCLLMKFLDDMKLDKKTSKRMARCTLAASRDYAVSKLQGKNPDTTERYTMAQPLIALHRALYAEYEKMYLNGVSKEAVLMNRFDERFAELEAPVFDESLNIAIDVGMKELRKLIDQKLAKKNNTVVVFDIDAVLLDKAS